MPCTSMGFVIGVDAGTESLRAGVFTSTGTLAGSCACPYPTQYPQPGWAEQQPDDWWQSLGNAVKGAIKAACISADAVAAICIDTTCCTVCALNADGDPVRPALLWMDMRSASEAGKVAGTGDEALRVNSAGHGPVSAEWMVPKALWIKTHEPDVWSSSTYICEFQDYINLKLTGSYVGSLNNVSVRWHYDINRGWPISLLQKLGLEDLLQRWPSKLVAPGEIVGQLTETAASHLGLPPGLIVAQGGADAFIGMIGLGVTQPGQMALLTGSSHLQLGMSAQQVTGRGMFGSYNSAVLPGLHVVEGGQTSTGSIVNWFKRTLCSDVSYEQLDREAAAVQPGCDGVACLDHFQGNRTPHTDALSRGAITGLTLAHGRGHVFRALLESVAYGTRLILDTMRAAGYSPDSIVIAGGATRSKLWLQIHADVAGVPFILTEQPEAPMLGCAVLAAVAAGLHPDIHTAAAHMVKVSTTIMPQPEVHAAYQQPYSQYCALYPALAGIRPQHSAKQEANNSKQQALTTPQVSSALPKVLAPSILAADFSRLADEVEAVLSAGAHWIHVDMFDGSGLARGNFTVGPGVVASLHKAVPHAYLDCHLAVDDPCQYVDAVAAAGASSITFHLESPGILKYEPGTGQPQVAGGRSQQSRVEAAAAVAAHIRQRGCKAGLAINPSTPAAEAIQLAQQGAVDMLLIMTVEPGWGGQQFMASVLAKVQECRAACPGLMIQGFGKTCARWEKTTHPRYGRELCIMEQLFDSKLQVDGGINTVTAGQAADAGANVFVAGSAVYGKPDDDSRKPFTYTKPVSQLLSSTHKPY